MEVIFIFLVATFISIGVVEEVVVPASEYAIEKGTEVYDAGKELITGTETE